ncbi:MAG: putative ABC transporter permease [Coriobacteriales bacterium]|nr:putative ABC transporter permease [Coriobacteriales bacterium]
MQEEEKQQTKPRPKHFKDPSYTPDKYPWFIRAYGILSIVGGCVQMVASVRAALYLIDLLSGGFNIAEAGTTGHASLTTIIIAAVLIVVSIVVSVIFFVLGVRLIRSKRHKAATLCHVMIGLETAVFLCLFMLAGLKIELLIPFVNIIILFVLEVYSDPSLRAERHQKHEKQKLADKEAKEAGTLGRDATGKGYITLNFFNVFWVFMICCVLGLVIETIWHMVVVELGVFQNRSGLLYGPFSPIYGFGAVLMTVALNRYYKSNPLVVFVVAGVIGAAFEYFVSWFLETAFGIVAWDYSGTFLNINGRTNFMFFCIWGLLGLVWLRWLLPHMLKLINKIPWNWRYSVTAVVAILMIVDGGLTLAAFDCWYERVAGTMDYEHCSAIVAFCNEHYDNEFMENRFQSMTMTTDSSSRA